MLSWRWKVEGVLARSDPRRKAGDDYAARVYVAFQYDPATAGAWERARYWAARLLYGRYPPGLALNYVWESRLPVGTVLDNAYSARAKIVVARSGAALAGTSVTETHDIYADYRRIVGGPGEPPRLEGIAPVTDTHDTGAPAAAIGEAVAGPGVVGGRFDVRFDSRRRVLGIVAWFMNVRSRATSICTGDQAIFVRRADFEAVGGYPDIPLMEDIELCRRLKTRGPLAALPPRVTPSARQRQREGPVRTLAPMR